MGATNTSHWQLQQPTPLLTMHTLLLIPVLPFPFPALAMLTALAMAEPVALPAAAATAAVADRGLGPLAGLLCSYWAVMLGGRQLTASAAAADARYARARQSVGKQELPPVATATRPAAAAAAAWAAGPVEIPAVTVLWIVGQRRQVALLQAASQTGPGKIRPSGVAAATVPAHSCMSLLCRLGLMAAAAGAAAAAAAHSTAGCQRARCTCWISCAKMY